MRELFHCQVGAHCTGRTVNDISTMIAKNVHLLSQYSKPYFLDVSQRSDKVEMIFQADVSSKKRTNKFNFITMIPQADLFFVHFLEEIEDSKKTFKN